MSRLSQVPLLKDDSPDGYWENILLMFGENNANKEYDLANNVNTHRHIHTHSYTHTYIHTFTHTHIHTDNNIIHTNTYIQGVSKNATLLILNI